MMCSGRYSVHAISVRLSVRKRKESGDKYNISNRIYVRLCLSSLGKGRTADVLKMNFSVGVNMYSANVTSY